MFFYKRHLMLLSLTCMFIAGYAQTPGANQGLIKGTVKDSLTGEVLPMATVSTYRSKDSAFLGALFSGNNGSFVLRTLPIDTAITLTISYVGHKRYVTRVSLTPNKSELQLGDILLSDNVLSPEVVIVAEVPPMRMKGDTLEINPAAFNAGPNAVIEDVLKKVPGIVVWGDNKITVNGKTVTQLLVDGKPFLTGTITVATQNLPPESIKKVQVYPEDKKNPDEQQTMNLILKPDRKKGAFGRLSAGLGTNHRYEGDVTWSKYKPGQQLSVGAFGNNINKNAAGLGGMLQFNTYRGNISNPAYQSNFAAEGVNTYYGIGLIFNKELTEKRFLKSDYYSSNNIQDVNRSQSSVMIVGDSSFLEKSNGNSRNKNWQHQATANYDLIKNKDREARLEARALTGMNEITSTYQAMTQSSSGRLLNRYIQEEKSHNNLQNVHLQFLFNNHPQQSSRGIFQLEHVLNLSNNKGDRFYKTDYESYGAYGDTLERRQLSRLFKEVGRSVENQLNISYSINYLFNRLRNMMLVKKLYSSINVVNNLHHIYRTDNFLVNDFVGTSAEIVNNYLTNTNIENYLEERPGIAWKFDKKINFSDRYEKGLSFSGIMERQYKTLHNNSDKAFRNINTDYAAWLPSATVVYRYNKAKAFSRESSLKYYTRTRIPNINELVPLIDSTNLLYIRVGNPHLRMEYISSLVLDYHSSKTVNNQVIGGTLSGQSFRNKIVINTNINQQGRQVVSLANATNYQNVEINIYFNKPIKLQGATLAVEANSRMSIGTGDLYLNNQERSFEERSSSIFSNFNFIKGPTELNLSQAVQWTGNKLYLAELRQTSGFNYTAIAMLQHKFKKLILASNLNVVYSEASQLPNLTRCIWNVTIAYRMLKNEQLEFKLSLNDLLKQSVAIKTEVFQNRIIQSEVNRLTQFALFSLSYYPRKFGNKITK